jgi:creatinine amidohydrolase
VIVPAGSTEQHGPHLPLDTDSFLCTQVAEAAALRANATGPVVVTPTFWLGSSAHHMNFAGTLTADAATFGRSIHEICRSLASHGFRRQLVLNGHGGNSALLAEAVRHVGFHERIRIATLDYWALARDAAEEVRESPPGGMGHACEFETSLMLHLRPESVRMDLIAREIVEPRSGLERLDLFLGGPLVMPWKTHELSRSGVMGAPDLATAEKGRRLFEACVDGLVGLVDELRS